MCVCVYVSTGVCVCVCVCMYLPVCVCVCVCVERKREQWCMRRSLTTGNKYYKFSIFTRVVCRTIVLAIEVRITLNHVTVTHVTHFPGLKRTECWGMEHGSLWLLAYMVKNSQCMWKAIFGCGKISECTLTTVKFRWGDGGGAGGG